MRNPYLIFYFVVFLIMNSPELCGAWSFSAGNSAVADAGGGGSAGWTSVAGSVSVGRKIKDVDSSTSSGGEDKSNSGWENFGWVGHDDGSWARKADIPDNVVATQKDDWWTEEMVDFYETPFVEQAPTTTKLVRQWSVDSLPESSTATHTQTNDAGQSIEITTTVTNWETTRYGEFKTIVGQRKEGVINTQVWNLKHFGEFEITETYNVEVLTPYENHFVKTDTGSAGSDPVDVKDAPFSEGIDYGEHMESVLPDGEKGMTVGPDGNPVKLEDLSEELSEPVDYEFRMKEAASTKWPPPVQLGNSKKPERVVLDPYVLTYEKTENLFTETRTLEEEPIEKKQKVYEKDIPSYVSKTEVRKLGTEQKSSTTVIKTVTTLADEWTERNMVGSELITETEEAVVIMDVRSWAGETEPVIEETTATEANPDNPNQRRTVTTITASWDVNSYEQDVRKVQEQAVRTYRQEQYNLKHYGRYKKETTKTVDGKQNMLDPVFETRLLGEEMITQKNLVNEVINPAYEEDVGAARIVSVENKSAVETVYGEWENVPESSGGSGKKRGGGGKDDTNYKYKGVSDDGSERFGNTEKEVRDKFSDDSNVHVFRN